MKKLRNVCLFRRQNKLIREASKKSKAHTKVKPVEIGMGVLFQVRKFQNINAEEAKPRIRDTLEKLTFLNWRWTQRFFKDVKNLRTEWKSLVEMTLCKHPDIAVRRQKAQIRTSLVVQKMREGCFIERLEIWFQ